MILFSICTSSTGLRTLLIIKILLQVICTIIPLVIIYRAFSVSFKSSIDGGESAKKDLSTLFKSFIAGLIIFLVPTVINYTFTTLLDTKNDFVICINNASLEGVLAAEAKEEQEAADKKKAEEAKTQKINKEMQNKRKKEIEEAAEKRKEQEKTHGKMNFSCTSDNVKAQFSCSTLKIVEKHLYDVNAQNFHQVINSYGGFDNYAKSVGGIFGEYYGKKIEGRTEKDFQIAAEYVLGWMYMYGWDYAMPGGSHVKWGGKNYTKDAFYANGNFAVEHCDNESPGAQATGMGTNFDGVISTENQGGSVNKMASACGDLEVFIYNKMNINRKKQLPKVSRLKDLKVGDCMFFGDGGPKWDKYNEKTWYHAERAHNVVIGEVYPDHVVIYDGGSFYPSHKNYKRELYFPKEDTEAADDAAVKEVFGYSYWGIRRWYNFES